MSTQSHPNIVYGLRKRKRFRGEYCLSRRNRTARHLARGSSLVVCGVYRKRAFGRLFGTQLDSRLPSQSKSKISIAVVHGHFFGPRITPSAQKSWAIEDDADNGGIYYEGSGHFMR